MNEIIKQEGDVVSLGVAGRASSVVQDDKTGLIRNQTMKFSRGYKEGDYNYRITTKIRFDDECKNGHESFSITADIRRSENGVWREDKGGCCHGDIAARFPEFADLIKWHLCSTDGPMHYLSNSVYLAGDRDSSGRKQGEPSSFKEGVRLGNSPITYKLGSKFHEWLKVSKNNPAYYDFTVMEVPYKKKDGDTFDYPSKFTLEGFDCEWYKCEFDNITEANEFALAMNTLPVTFVAIPTAFSKGKHRELGPARRAAVWPEATDDELSQETDLLKAALTARLPKLLADFRSAMEGCGFIWPIHKVAEVEAESNQ